MDERIITMLEIGVGIAAAGALYYTMFHKGGADNGGPTLWASLGFPYGPIGNLPAVGGPAQQRPIVGALGAILTDTHGNVLRDEAGQPLKDSGGGIFSFPAYNNSRLHIGYYYGGSFPS